MKEKSLYIRLIPVMLVFFTMGFVDLVGIASNYVKLDLGLTDSGSEYLSFLSVLLVPDLLCPDGDVDE